MAAPVTPLLSLRLTYLGRVSHSLQMDPFALSTVRSVFDKRGVAITDAGAVDSHTAVWRVTAPLLPAERSVHARFVASTQLQSLVSSVTSPQVRTASVGYLFSAAVKDASAVNVRDSRLKQWSPQSLTWRLPALVDTDAPTARAGAGTLEVLAASVGR